jgi:uncharacterized repeat protein (TIGR02543 family)
MANEYTVSYNVNGGDSAPAVGSRHTYGAPTALAKNQYTKTGYTFVKWNTRSDGLGDAYDDEYIGNLTDIDGFTATLYAQWDANEYAVAYDANGGEGTMTDEPRRYDDPKPLSGNGFTKTGYTFLGWNTAANGSGTSYAEGYEGNLTDTDGATARLYAQWTLNEYTIIYNSNGGDSAPVTTGRHRYGADGALTPNAYTRAGYTFAGWALTPDGAVTYTDGESVKDWTAENDITLYARWTGNKYTVSYDKNYADGIEAADAMPGSEHTYGTPTPLIKNEYAREGYSFAGWNTAADGSGAAYADGQYVSTLAADGTATLYAQWIKAETGGIAEPIGGGAADGGATGTGFDWTIPILVLVDLLLLLLAIAVYRSRRKKRALLAAAKNEEETEPQAALPAPAPARLAAPAAQALLPAPAQAPQNGGNITVNHLYGYSAIPYAGYPISNQNAACNAYNQNAACNAYNQNAACNAYNAYNNACNACRLNGQIPYGPCNPYCRR